VARLLKRFCLDTEGSVALEYALIGGIVSVAVIVGALSIGTHLNGALASIAPWMK